MRSYRGPHDDQPFGKFGHMTGDGIAHESFNFLPTDGICYGYVAVNSLNLERLGNEEVADTIENILVVWTATNPEDKARYIVGFYNGATVHRYPEKRPKDKEVQTSFRRLDCLVSAPSRQCWVVPVSSRRFRIPNMEKGYPGRSRSFYTDNSSLEWISSIRTYAATRRLPAIFKKSDVFENGVAYADPEHRQKIERAAVDRVMFHFEKLG